MDSNRRDIGMNKRKRSPSPSPVLQTRGPNMQVSPFQHSLLLYRLPSPSIHWEDIDDKMKLCHPRASEVEPMSILSCKRSFTIDRLANLCSQLKEDSVPQHAGVTRLVSASTRTVTPVPSLVFSQTSCATAVDSDPASSPIEFQDFKMRIIPQRPASRHPHSLSRSVERTYAPNNPCQRRASSNRSSRASSPLLSTFEYDQYQHLVVHKTRLRDRPLPPLPVEALAQQRASEVSFIDWDSEDEDDNSNQFSKVNAILKKSIAELRPSSRTGQRKDYGGLKFGLSVVLENPSARTTSSSLVPTAPMTTNSFVRRNATSPLPDTSSLRSTNRPSISPRSTVTGYEDVTNKPEQYKLPSTIKYNQIENTQRDRVMGEEKAAHRDKRRRISKFSEWVKRRLSNTSS